MQQISYNMKRQVFRVDHVICHLTEIGTLAIKPLTLHDEFLVIAYFPDAVSQKFLNMFKMLWWAAISFDFQNRDRCRRSGEGGGGNCSASQAKNGVERGLPNIISDSEIHLFTL